MHTCRPDCRELSTSHPARSLRDFVASSTASGVQPSLQKYLDWKSQALLNGTPAALQYGDLHGVPMMLVLCEKGRMGDTFPQTFRCACTARACILPGFCPPSQAASMAALVRYVALSLCNLVHSTAGVLISVCELLKTSPHLYRCDMPGMSPGCSFCLWHCAHIFCRSLVACVVTPQPLVAHTQ